MTSALFTPEQEEIIRGNPIKKIIDVYGNNLPNDLSSFDQDIDEDSKSRVRVFLFTLAATAPAELIKLTGSRDDLSDKLIRFTRTWSREGKFPRSEFSTLLDKVASRASDLDIWTAVAQLLIAFEPNTPLKSEILPSRSRHSSAVLNDLQRDWNNPYFPHSLDALKSLIQQYQQLGVEQYYARTLVFVQSSGTGKSRLVDSFGQVCPMINFILRDEGITGDEGTTDFPLADHEILSFLREKPSFNKINMTHVTNLPDTSDIQERMATTVWNHALAAALLQASFEKFNVWVESQPYTTISLQALASSRHTEMAPLTSGPNALDNGQRSMNRIEFCQSVAERARVIANDLISHSNWVMRFGNEAPSEVHCELEFEEPSNVLNGLRIAVKNLIDNLQQTSPRGNNDPFLVVVFDEASSIIETAPHEPRPGLYIALSRIISCLKEYPLWSFFLSTDSSIGQLISPGNAKRTGHSRLTDSSARYVLPEIKPPLKRFPPFVALQLDVENRRRMQDPDRRVEELRKPLSDFAKPKHMALFGRPLWYAYEDSEDMNREAKLKLLGGKQFSTTFNPMNKDHVFAALSFRLSLDVCSRNPSSLLFTRTAVNSFMRVAISMNQETGTMDTLTPSEPVLAKAAMEHLCSEANWTNSIRTLTQQLLEPGLIDKGHKGELYARLVLILAHDLVRWITSEPVSKSTPKFRPTFTVFDFLTALYGEDYRGLIHEIPEQIGMAKMNFTHFVPAYATLTSEIIPALCHDLLRRSAAMQLAEQEEVVDLLLPIYYGQEEGEFDPSKYGVILVQVKNQSKAITPEGIFKENFTKVSPKDTLNSRIWDAANSIRQKPNFAFKQMTNPVLFLLFDLGVVRSARATSPLIQVSHSEMSPVLWTIHSRGHDKAVFGCLERMDTTDASQQFFTSMPQGKSLADQLAGRNRTFYHLKRSYRYSEFDSEEEDDVDA